MNVILICYRNEKKEKKKEVECELSEKHFLSAAGVLYFKSTWVFLKSKNQILEVFMNSFLIKTLNDAIISS